MSRSSGLTGARLNRSAVGVAGCRRADNSVAQVCLRVGAKRRNQMISRISV